jgi:ornithine cyclodeaminase/alanine dehydrogenase-like protein (mu-crystallin family)
VASRSPQRGRAFVDEVANLGLSARLCDSVEEAVRGADIVITTTPSTAPIVDAEWLEAGTHVTAVGSDEPNKQELAPDVLARADVVAVDDRRQAASFGELHHVIGRGVREEDVVTLGELLEGVAQGRVGADDITVADLTGVGVQDAAIASLVVREATRAQVAHLDLRSVPSTKRQ